MTAELVTALFKNTRILKFLGRLRVVVPFVNGRRHFQNTFWPLSLSLSQKKVLFALL